MVLPLSTTVRYLPYPSYIQRSPISWLQYEVQRLVLPTPNQCWCISENSSSGVGSSSPFCFSVLTLHYRYIIYSFVLPRVALVRRILEITCELNIARDTLSPLKASYIAIIALGRSPCGIYVLLGYRFRLRSHGGLPILSLPDGIRHCLPFLLSWLSLSPSTNIPRCNATGLGQTSCNRPYVRSPQLIIYPNLMVGSVYIAVAGHAVGHCSRFACRGLANP